MQWTTTERRWAATLLVVSSLWAGLLVGVSFIATPAKFLAPSLGLPVALDVGRNTFAVFNKLEWVCGAAVVALLAVGVRTRTSMVAASITSALVIADTIWLLPALDQRVRLILAGQQPLASNLHIVYVAMDLLKLVALLVLVFAMARGLAWPDHASSAGTAAQEPNRRGTEQKPKPAYPRAW